MRSVSTRLLRIVVPACALAVSSTVPQAVPQMRVEVLRLPEGALQPDVAIAADGVLHVVYLAGELMASDVFHVRSPDGGRSFSRPVRVNSEPGSAVAAGTIRGAHVAVEPGGRVHVAWNGSSSAIPRPPVNPKTNRAGMPMLYARSRVDGTSFEPQRNLMTQTTDLDGGGSIAADDRGVYVAWHANGPDGEGGEAGRRVYLTRSLDGGATFERERPVSDAATGVCGCCAVDLASVAGELRLLYRSASAQIHRDVFSLVSKDRGTTFDGRKLHGWQISACPMTSMSIAAAGGPAFLAAWETDGEVYFTSTRLAGAPRAPAPSVTGDVRRKHPRLAVASDGTILMVWTEIGARTRPGVAAWQAFAADGSPRSERATAVGVPGSSFAVALARPDGGFTVLY